MSTLKRKGLNYRGVRFRVWLYFTLFSCALIILMSSILIIMYRALYQNTKVAEMAKVVTRLSTQQGPDALITEMRTSAFVSGAVIYVFKVENEEVSWCLVAGNNSQSEEPTVTIPKEMNDMLINAISKLPPDQEFPFGSNTYFADVMTGMSASRLNYVAKHVWNGSQMYFLIQSPYTMSDFNSTIFSRQLIFTLLFSLLLSLLLSYILARHLSQPFMQLNESAKRLAKGDYDVKFNTCGYTEIDDLAATLNLATEEMKNSDSLRKDLVANISHELRTPLTMIKAYAEMIRDLSGDNPVKRAEHLQVILDEANRLSALVTDILDLSKIQSSAEPINNNTLFNLSEMINQVMDRFDGMFCPKGFTIDRKIVGNAYVIADPKHIGQVVYNLVANALNYVGEDKYIFVTLKEENNCYAFRVSDHGKGIEPKDLEHIWDRYFRSAEAKRAKVGSGIGLSIVKGICEAQGLQYGVSSTVGEGSTFYVIFNKVEPTGHA